MNHADTAAKSTSRAPIQPTAVLCFSPSAGGMEMDALRMASNLNQHLGRALLVVREGTWLHREAEANGIAVAPIHFRGSFSLQAIRAMRRLWRAHQITNLVFLGSSEIKSIHFSLTPGIQRFIVRHGTTKRSPKKDWIRRLTWSRVTSHWCISDHLRQNVTELFPIGKAACFVNHVSLPAPDSLPEVSSKGGPIDLLSLAHTGRLAEGKGQDDAIRVIARLRDAGIPAHLTLYGEGPQREALESLAQELGVEDAVTLAGFVAAPYREYSRHHAFLFPSHGEGFGNAFVEALATGLPAFCYANTVFPELRELGLAFEMVPDGDVVALSDAIEQAWQRGMPPSPENIAQCHEHFSVEHEMQRLRPYLV
ncbi:glycosyltransferase [Bisbaumannia pacifica]|uniref:Glycosyltransferase n=1 Tax=Bisbaumannia pacifica TaxID=77098 RepID=A0ABD4L358_9GAMM|nr:glycosyltransferase [Halomonas pacifica]MBH8581170.1 glycosyltransferase [Halomonas pacifica]